MALNQLQKTPLVDGEGGSCFEPLPSSSLSTPVSFGPAAIPAVVIGKKHLLYNTEVLQEKNTPGFEDVWFWRTPHLLPTPSAVLQGPLSWFEVSQTPLSSHRPRLPRLMSSCFNLLVRSGSKTSSSFTSLQCSLISWMLTG